MHKYFFYLILFINLAFAQQAKHVEMGAKSFKHQNKTLLALNFINEKHWHTYWKNPGDAGLEIKVKFYLGDKEIKLKDYPWPTPKRYIEQGNMWAYGYSKEYSLFFELNEALKNQNLKIVATWLVCKDICIPGSQTINLNLNQNLLASQGPSYDDNKLVKRFINLPRKGSESNLSLFLTKAEGDNKLALHYILENVKLAQIREKSNIITPYLASPFDYKHEEVYFDSKTNTLFGRFYVDWDGAYEEPTWDLPKDGQFKRPMNALYLLNYPKDVPSKIISQSFTQFTLSGDKKLSKKYDSLTPLDEIQNKVKKNQKSEQSTFLILIFAFLGGLILNLMPCVLPVISLKLFGLIVHKDESKINILKHNLSYTAGVLFSFSVLASIVAILKTTGESIGWGFQLQSPIFVFFMIIILFVMSLNMFGLFEFVTPGGKTLTNKALKAGFSADFFNGVLATILSTPCSAPFLGTALTFAFTSSVLLSFLVFLFVGFGLSFPFILTGFFPRLIHFLPNPGAWMQVLKYFLGLSLLLTCVWLIDVLFGIVNFTDVGLYFALTLSMIFFSFFFYRSISKNKLLNLLLILSCFILFIQTQSLFKDSQTQSLTTLNTQWEKWSPEKVSASKGEYLFINFTAKWCLTCKVNKKLVLESAEFKKLAKEKNIRLLEGDWTKKDDAITNFLAGYNIVGVPAYFIKTPSGKILSLGETISISKIKENL